MPGAWLLLLLLCVAVAGAAEAGIRGSEPAERLKPETTEAKNSERRGRGVSEAKKTEVKENNKRGRQLEEDEDSFVNYGNSVLIGPAPPRLEASPTRINSKFKSSAASSSPPRGPPKTSIFRTSMSSSSVPQSDIADILTNLQILNILTTQDSLATHPKDVLLGVRNEGIRTPVGQMAGVYNIAARNSLLEEQHQQYLHQLLLNPSPDPAGPSLASPFDLPPLHSPPLHNETNASDEENLVHLPDLADPPDSTPSHAHSMPSPAHSTPDPTHSFQIPTHFTPNPAHSIPNPAHSISKPAHSFLNPALSTPSPAHSATTPAQSTPATVHFILGPVPIHSIPSPSHSFFDTPHSTPSLAPPSPTPPHPPIGPAHSIFNPAHSTPRPAPSTLSPTPSTSSSAHTFLYPTVTPAHSTFSPTVSPAPPSSGAEPLTSSSSTDKGEGGLDPMVPPPGIDLSHIISQLTEADTAGPAPPAAPTPALPSLDQLTALSQYLQWLKQLQQEQMQLLQQQQQQQQQQQEQQLELELGPGISEEMILASLLHTHHVQEADQGPVPPPIEAPYVPALHGPFADYAAPAPAPPPEFTALPPAPPDSSEDLSLLPQADAGGGGGGGGGLKACVKAGGCALLAAGAVALGFTLAIATPVVLPALAAAGMGRRRRRATTSEGSGVVLEYLRQNRGALLAAGMAQVEAEVGRPLDPVLRQILEQGDPRHLLPLLMHTLAGPAPRSSGLLREICEAVASPGMPPSTPTVVTAQHCLLLASAGRL